ncbi:MAG: choline-sulfatase [Candidatus Krumholzibacteriia bacterium]|jgi:choline-sulfatase
MKRICYIKFIGLSFLFLVGAGCDSGPDTRQANLILISLDTLRADYLGCYGQATPVSPHLDQLAESAIVFEKAYATAPFTGPSHASILTSQHPSTHGMIYNGHRARNLAIGERSVTLAEHLGQAGFNTKAIVSGGPLAARFGFGRGFESFNLVPQLDNLDSGGDPEQITQRAGNWLLDWHHSGQKERFFLWVHHFTPHLPYVGRPADRASLGMAFDQTVDDKNVATLPLQNVRDAYGAEVLAADRFVGELLAKLEELGMAENTVIAVVSDHGEYLQEHGLTNHHRLFDEVLHVPMFIHWPKWMASDRRSGSVSTLDLAPTLLDMLGVSPLPYAQGRSLLAAETNESEVAVFAEWRDFRLLSEQAPRKNDFLISVQLGQKKLIRDILFPQASQSFDLAQDPRELHPIDGEFMTKMNTLLDTHLQEGLPEGLAGVGDINLDAKSLEMLRSLGYVR